MADEAFDQIAQQAGNFVGQSEVALRQFLGDELYDFNKAVGQLDAINGVEKSRQEAALLKARSGFYSMFALLLFVVTLAVVSIITWVIVR